MKTSKPSVASIQKRSASLDLARQRAPAPAREVPLDAEGVKAFRKRWRTRFEGDPTQTSIYRGVSEGLAPPGIEFYLPLFFDETATLFDYLPKDAVIVRDASLTGALVKDWAAIEQRYDDRRHDIERPIVAPSELFLQPEELEERIDAFQAILLNAFKADLETADGERAQLPDHRTTRNARRCACRAAFRAARLVSRSVWRPRAHRRRLAGPTRSAARDAARSEPQGRHRLGMG